MGQEIESLKFSDEDEEIFHQKLREETKILKRWFDQSVFEPNHPKCGLELEAWLVTKDFVPAPLSHDFISKLNHPMVVPEISKFNFELNSDPLDVEGKVFSKLEAEIMSLWKKCEDFAESMNLRALIIGTLPTLRDHMMTLDNLSPQKRYFALNERVMEMRKGCPIVIDLEGRDQIHIEHDDVLTECAATSLQIHYGINQENAVPIYNASVVASCFIAAVGANSPLFFGKQLWDESRVCVFEQAVNVRSFRRADGQFAERVGMGNGYIRSSLLELFIENLDGYPPLLPEHHESDPEWLDHLRLHNGTIWRWNRPLIGLGEGARPGLRLEFRIPSAGPTIADAMANMVFQIGVVEYLASLPGLTERINFETACRNFYSACRKGLDSEIIWLDGKKHTLAKVIVEEILPQAFKHLEAKGLDRGDIEHYLYGIIKPRVEKKQNGAGWQKAFVAKHGYRFQELLEYYYGKQKENVPVHEWEI